MAKTTKVGLVALAALSVYAWKVWKELNEATPAPVEVATPDTRFRRFPQFFWDQDFPEDWTEEQKDAFDKASEPSYVEHQLKQLKDTEPGVELKPMTPAQSEATKKLFAEMGERERVPAPSRREALGLPSEYVTGDGLNPGRPKSALLIPKVPRDQRLSHVEVKALELFDFIDGAKLKPALEKKVALAKKVEKLGTTRVWFGPDGKVERKEKSKY